MTTAITNTVSTFIESQLPGFVKDDNPDFTQFVKAYYEWLELESQKNVIYRAKNLLSYNDVDETTDEFIKYFLNNFLPNFPQSVALDERKLLKAARDFYQKKGSIESIQFLFRVLYGKEAEIYYPKDNILKASDGKWTQPQGLRLTVSAENEDFDYTQLVQRIGVGSVSNASCVIESASLAVDPALGIPIVELFISNLTKPLEGSEYLNIEYDQDGNNVPIIFTEKIIGSLSDIRINPSNRGLKYKGIIRDNLNNIVYPGDPVVIIGGLADSPEAREAIAYVGNVTTGSISSVSVNKRGYGYRVQPNTVVTVVRGPSDTTGAGANVIVQSVDTANAIYKTINIDAIQYHQAYLLSDSNFFFPNTGTTNANTILSTAFAWANLQFSPLTSMNVVNGGGGYTQVPTINLAVSYYTDFTSDLANIADITNVNATRQYMYDLGHFAAVEVVRGGLGYSNVTDRIVCQSSIGYDAAFDFTTAANGAITSVIVTNRGEGYVPIPPLALANTANVANAANGSNAVLVGYGFGEGATLNIAVNKIGAITDIRMVSRGFDYISTPNVSLRIQDLKISPISNSSTFLIDDVIFQGADANTATYRANIDSYNVSTRTLRVYNYQGTLNASSNLNVTGFNVTINLAATSNVVTYGDGKAKANAIFLNGLVQYPGFFFNTDGFLSSDKYLQDTDTYHNFSYVIVVEQAMVEYKKALMQIAHPTGTSMLGKFVVQKANAIQTFFDANVDIQQDLTGDVSVNAFSSTANAIGVNTFFDVAARAGDYLTFNYNDSSRPTFTKIITNVYSPTIVGLESNTRFMLETYCSVVNTSNVITTTESFVGNVAVSDIVRLNVSGNVINSIVQVVSANTISVNTIFAANASNLILSVFPSINNASYNVVFNAG